VCVVMVYTIQKFWRSGAHSDIVIPVISKRKNIDSIWLFLVQTLLILTCQCLWSKRVPYCSGIYSGCGWVRLHSIKYCASVSMLVKPSKTCGFWAGLHNCDGGTSMWSGVQYICSCALCRCTFHWYIYSSDTLQVALSQRFCAHFYMTL